MSAENHNGLNGANVSQSVDTTFQRNNKPEKQSRKNEFSSSNQVAKPKRANSEDDVDNQVITQIAGSKLNDQYGIVTCGCFLLNFSWCCCHEFSCFLF